MIVQVGKKYKFRYCEPGAPKYGKKGIVIAEHPMFFLVQHAQYRECYNKQALMSKYVEVINC